MRSITFTISLLFSGLVTAAPLTKDAPETAQLKAMGYELQDLEDSTLVTRGDEDLTILINKDEIKTLYVRLFPRNKKVFAPNDELKFLQAINRLNFSAAYQVSFSDTSIACVVYQYGAYDPQIFSSLVRFVERCEIIFTAEPVLTELTK